MADCLFCKIASGEIPAKVVHQDEHTLAFLDINPLRRGHTLLIPKRHVARLSALGPEDAANYLRVVPHLVAAIEKALGAEGATVAWNDGPAAGQEVGHVHLHIVPRNQGDGFGPVHALFEGGEPEAKEDLDEVQSAVEAALAD